MTSVNQSRKAALLMAMKLIAFDAGGQVARRVAAEKVFRRLVDIGKEQVSDLAVGVGWGHGISCIKMPYCNTKLQKIKTFIADYVFVRGMWNNRTQTRMGRISRIRNCFIKIRFTFFLFCNLFIRVIRDIQPVITVFNILWTSALFAPLVFLYHPYLHLFLTN